MCTCYHSVHYNDVIMVAITYQITSFTTVYSIVYSDADERKHQSSASVAFVRGIHRFPVNSPHKWPVTRKMLPFDDVIRLGQFGRKFRAFIFTTFVYLSLILFHHNRIGIDISISVIVVSPTTLEAKPGTWLRLGLPRWLVHVTPHSWYQFIYHGASHHLQLDCSKACSMIATKHN